MEIHNPRNLNLPPLKILQRNNRKNVESDIAVKSLISSKLLLNKVLNQLLVFFLGMTKEIDRLIIQKENKKKKYKETITALNRLKLKFKKDTKRQSIINEMENEFKEKTKKENQKLEKEIQNKSDEIQADLDSFETKHKIKLNILNSFYFFSCKNCNQFVCQERFHSTTCNCGERIKNPSDCDNLTILKLGDNIINFIESNMWLEYGIDHLLKRKNFETLCGFFVLGHSGLSHEIDNIAEIKTDNLRFFCECKNTDIKVNDVFVFIGKMSDVGCTRGYIFTTSFETANDVKHLARSKNISIIDQVLERDDDEIIKDIKEGEEVLFKTRN